MDALSPPAPNRGYTDADQRRLLSNSSGQKPKPQPLPGSNKSRSVKHAAVYRRGDQMPNSAQRSQVVHAGLRVADTCASVTERFHLLHDRRFRSRVDRGFPRFARVADLSWVGARVFLKEM